MTKLLLGLALAIAAQAANYDVKAFGAKGDGTTNDTAAFQAAYNAASATARGDVVTIPAGIYKVGTITLNSGNNVVIQGLGRGSVLVPLTSSTTVFSNSASTGYMNTIEFRDLTIDGSSYAGVNSAIGMNIVSAINIRVYNVMCNNVFECVVFDRVTNGYIRDMLLLDNSTIYVGSTVDGAANYSFYTTLNNIKSQATVGSPGVSLSYTGAIINFERAVGANLINFDAEYLGGTTKGISLRNDCQNVTIQGGAMFFPTKGIEIVSNTVGATTASPLHTVITGGYDIDNYATYGIYAPAGIFTKIHGIEITNGKNTAAAGIYIASQNGAQVNDVDFQAGAFAGNALVFDGASGFQAMNNHFSMQVTGGGVDIWVTSTAGADHYAIMGNLKDSGDTVATFILDQGTGTNKTVQSTNHGG